MDVVPLSLGIKTSGGKFSVLIPKNTTIPYKHSKIYYNNEDDQTFAKIQVLTIIPLLPCQVKST